jgi:hypothetical protein
MRNSSLSGRKAKVALRLSMPTYRRFKLKSFLESSVSITLDLLVMLTYMILLMRSSEKDHDR